MTSVSDVLVVV